MKKGLFNRENIEKIVRLVPRPTMDGKLIARSRNFWLVLQEYSEGVEIQNKMTNHGGKIPFDSIREWREPDMVILLAQLNLGKDGVFELSPFVDGPETEMMTEEEESLPARRSYAEIALGRCTEDQIRILRELLIRVNMTTHEIHQFCSSEGIPYDLHFFETVRSHTSFLERNNNIIPFTVWIKPAFVPILEKLLFKSNGETVVAASHPPSSVVPGSHVS
jgi:hypothetical protein